MIDYVLVRADRNRVLEVHRDLARLGHVREVHPLFGEWDFIVKVSAEPSLEGADVLWTISGIAGVHETKWLGVSRITSEPRHASNLSYTQTRSDAL